MKTEEVLLTVEEKSVIQSELPLRFGRLKGVSWNNLESANKLEGLLNENPVIGTNSIVLVSFGPNGGQQRGVQINTEGQDGFKVSELLWKANLIQSEIYDRSSAGIGIYRLGYDKGIPSFYIGEYLDLAGTLKE